MVDSVGSTWADSIACLRPGGRVVVFGGTGGGKVELTVRPVTLGQVSLLGTTMGSPRDFAGLLAAVEHASWTPVIDSVRPLAEAADAHAREEAGDHFGKLVLSIARPPGPVAALVLAAARREIGRRAAAGRGDPALEVDALAAALEADPAARAALAEAEAARRPAELFAGEPSGARALRERRAAEAHRAVGDLLLAGELVADGAGRVRLPGFGTTTWRAIALLRSGEQGPERRLAETVAAEPASDLGSAAPTFMGGLRADPRLLEAARLLHALEAVRQDARNALLAAAAALVAAVDAGHEDSADIVRADCAALEARIAEIDAAIEDAWRAGVRQAAAIAD